MTLKRYVKGRENIVRLAAAIDSVYSPERGKLQKDYRP